MEKTLILLKHDTVERGLTGEVLIRFERTGLRVIDCRFLRPDLVHWEKHYEDLKERNFAAFDRSTHFLADRPVIALVLEGCNAIQKARNLIGVTDPLKAQPGTIRGDFSLDSIEIANQMNRATDNLVHASDGIESARREIMLWFPDLNIA